MTHNISSLIKNASLWKTAFKYRFAFETSVASTITILWSTHDDLHEWCLYYKYVLALALALASSITIISDAPSCGYHSDDSRGIFYDGYMFIVKATVLYK